MSRFARCTHQADRLPAVVRRSDLYGSVEADHGLIALFGVVHAIALLEVDREGFTVTDASSRREDVEVAIEASAVRIVHMEDEAGAAIVRCDQWTG